MGNELAKELREYQDRHKYQRLGGWLILPALNLLGTVIRAGWNLFELLALFQSERWSILTTPGREAYHRMWALLLVYESVWSVLVLVGGIVLAVCFEMKKRFVPTFFIAFLLASLVLAIGDLELLSRVPAAWEHSHVEGTRTVGAAVIGCAIWIPYFMMSKRVKATFVK